MQDRPQEALSGATSNRRAFAALPCGNADHHALLGHYDRIGGQLTAERETRRSLEVKLAAMTQRAEAAEREVGVLNAVVEASGIQKIIADFEARVREANERTEGWREEFEYVRKDRNEAYGRALAAEERVQQGLLRESRLIGYLETLVELRISPRSAVHPTEAWIVCTSCGSLTCEDGEGKISADSIEHARECKLKPIIDDLARWKTLGLDVSRELRWLREVVVQSGILERLGRCPSCKAERTNGEQHDDDCPLMKIATMLVDKQIEASIEARRVRTAELRAEIEEAERL